MNDFWGDAPALSRPARVLLVLCTVVFLVAAFFVAQEQPALGAGTATPTVSRIGGSRYVKVSIAWTSTAGGAVSGNALSVPPGYLIQAQFIPGSGGTQPTDLYDAVLNDAAAVDLLSGAGANLSNATSKVIQFNPRYFYDGQTLDLVVSNAGASKTGTFIIWVEQP